MQHENSDDPFGFWNDEPTRQLKRTQAGTRAHGDDPTVALRRIEPRRPETRMVPVVRSQRARPLPDAHLPRNPLITRLGVLIGVMLLLVPLALSLRNDKPRVRAAEIAAVETVPVGKLPAAAPTEAPTTLLATTSVLVTPVPSPPPVVVTSPSPTEAPTVAPTEPTAAPTTTAAPVKKKKAATTTTQAPPATISQAADKASCALTYVVAKNDAWSSIASRAKVTMKALLAANGATVNTVLLPGKTICLPEGAAAPGPAATSPPSTKPPSTNPPATNPPRTTPTTQPTTPPATTAPATTQPAPPPNVYTRAQVAQIIRDVWPDDLEDEAIRVATRESNLIPTVHNSCCYGLFQIYYTAHKAWLASMGITSAAQLYDPRVNATAALALYNSNGWAPWATSTPTTTAVA
ncbi:MAG: LysM peptidoglycan-binding domain-containing protein [Ilumatobacteraceae bacterium]